MYATQLAQIAEAADQYKRGCLTKGEYLITIGRIHNFAETLIWHKHKDSDLNAYTAAVRDWETQAAAVEA